MEASSKSNNIDLKFWSDAPMFNMLFKKKTDVNVAKKNTAFFLTVDDAKSISSNKNSQKTEVEAKKVVKVKNQPPAKIKNSDRPKKRGLGKSIFARKTKVNSKNGKGANLNPNLEVKEYWVDTDMDKFREMAKGLIASRPTKFM